MKHFQYLFLLIAVPGIMAACTGPDSGETMKNCELTGPEIRERQEFAYEAAVRMRDRFLQQETWERMGVDPATVIPRIFDNPDRREFQHLLFTKIVPNCKKLGLLDAGDAWLRRRFEEIGVIQYEDWVDTAEEVDSFALTRELTGEASPTAAA